MEKQPIPLEKIHDLVLLYLMITCGADQQLHPNERHAISVKIWQWMPDRNPAFIDHLVREAMLSYRNLPQSDHLCVLSEDLSRSLPDSLRKVFWWTLRRLHKPMEPFFHRKRT